MKQLLLFSFTFCLFAPKTDAQQLSNPNATKLSKVLYQNLHQLSKNYTLFGHQDDLAYGVGWKYIPNKSDIKDVVDDYPAVYGWDISKIEHNAANNIDGVPFTKMRQYIMDGYQRGAVITISWHFDNPLTGGSSWDTTSNTVKAILPGGEKHALFKTWLDRAAVFLHSLKGSKGEAIPILFRPFHELTGNWFWWGSHATTPEQMKQIWQFTADYLRKTKKLNQLILVYNTNDFKTEADFLRSYPGDDYVDVLSFDTYQFDANKKQDFINEIKRQSAIVTKLAAAKKKLAAFAETGFENVPDANWWTETLWPAIKDYPLSYVLVWRNAGYMPSTQKMHYYAPHKGQASASDFLKFYQNKKILFEKSLSTKKIYQTK
jgi:mannan endo-1,4-beta-mannosidase